MSGSVDDDRAALLIDLVDDSKVSPASGEQAVEFASKRLSHPSRVLGDRPEDGLEDGSFHFLGELAEVAEAFRRDLDLESHLQMILEPKTLARRRFATGATE